MQSVRRLPSPTKEVSLFLNLFASGAASYVERRFANSDPNLAQLVTFCSVLMSKNLLVHRVGAYASTSDHSGRQTVLGFTSYVSEFALDLFNDDPIGLRRSSCRELLRFILISDESITDVDIMSRMRVVGIGTVGNTVACITIFDANEFSFELRGRRKPLDLTLPQWLDRTHIKGLHLDPVSLTALRVLSDDGQVF
jgi:hypothetical protein